MTGQVRDVAQAGQRLRCCRAWHVIIAAIGLAAIEGCRPTPPVYRDPTEPVAARAGDLLRRMTLEEKFWQLLAFPDDTTRPPTQLTSGVFGLQVRAGTSPETIARSNALQRHFVTETRLGIPIILFEEALHGLVQPGATSFPQAIGLAASWDTALVGAVATAIARQTISRGVRQVLSPVINIATDPRWGRVEETYGEDPFLTSRMAVAYIRPFEQVGIVTTPKHFVANVGDGGRDSYPIELSRRWLEELHLPPFLAAIKEGGARAIMASYNSVDGQAASASAALLRETLRTRWHFGGFVISDAGAVGGAAVLHGTADGYPESARQALTAGLDVIFQGGGDRIKDLFWPAFSRGDIPQVVIDSAVIRVLRVKFQLGLFEQPYPADTAATRPDSAARRLALDAALASMTLLANRGALPLAPSVRRVALIGTDAVEGRLGGYSGPGNDVVSIRAALEARLGRERVRYEPGPGRTTGQFRTIPASAFEGGVQVEYFRGIELTGSPAVTNRVATIEANWPFGPPDSSLAAGWYAVRWSARLRAPSREPTQLVIDGNDGFRLWLDGKLIIDRWQKVSGGIVGAPVRLGDGNAHDVILEYFENVGPARIRLGWTLGGAWEDNARIARAVAIARGSQTAIIVAGIDEGEFQDRASLRLPGRQEELIRAVAATGVPIVVVLIGGSAVTMSDWVDSAGAVLLAWYPGEVGGTAVAATLVGDHNPAGRLPITFPQSEGQLPLSYFHRPTGRGDDYRDLSGRPQFPFGFGLSYTQFDYRDLGITPASPGAGDSVVVRFTLRNVGSIAGEEVPQVYLHDVVSSVASPVLTLAGFARLRLQPGEERQVTVTLAPDRFTMLDQELARRIEAGAVDIWVGASSADLRLRKRILVR